MSKTTTKSASAASNSKPAAKKAPVKARTAAKKTSGSQAVKKASVETIVEAPEELISPEGLKVGDKVKHASFGSGEVMSLSGDILEIAFKSSGTKFVRDDFVRKC